MMDDNFAILKNRTDHAIDDGIYEWAYDEIERLREENEKLKKKENGCWEIISWFIKYCHANGLKPDIVDLLEASLQQKESE